MKNNNKSYFKNKKIQNLLDSSKLISFDLNGLIVDDEPIQLAAANMTFLPYNIRIKKEYWINNCVGKNPNISFERILKDFNIFFNQEKTTISELVRTKNRYYSELIRKKIKDITRKGVLSFINYLSNNGYFKMAIVTSAEPEELESIAGEKGLNLLENINVLITGADVKRSKPDPEIYLTLIDRSGIAPEFILAFEDSQAGVNSATAAGIKCVAVPNNFTKHQDFRNAVLVINNLSPEAEIIIYKNELD